MPCSNSMLDIQGKVAWISPALNISLLEDIWTSAGGSIAKPDLVNQGQIIDYFFADPVEPCHLSKRLSQSGILVTSSVWLCSALSEMHIQARKKRIRLESVSVPCPDSLIDIGIVKSVDPAVPTEQVNTVKHSCPRPSTPLRLREMLSKPALSFLASPTDRASASEPESISSPYSMHDTDCVSHTDSPHSDFAINCLSPNAVIIDLDDLDHSALPLPYGLSEIHASHDFNAPLPLTHIKNESDLLTPKTTFLPTPSSSVSRVKVKIEDSSPAAFTLPAHQLGSPFQLRRSDCPSLPSSMPFSSPLSTRRGTKRSLDHALHLPKTNPYTAVHSTVLHVKHRQHAKK